MSLRERLTKDDGPYPGMAAYTFNRNVNRPDLAPGVMRNASDPDSYSYPLSGPVAVERPKRTLRRIDTDRVADLVRQLLVAVGEDPDRPGLAETPERVARWWREFLAYDPGNTETAFPSVATDQMVVVSGIRVWSLCEHHLLPFRADVAIGYLPRGQVLGLSKFGRIAHQMAHRLQIQEGLVEDIAAEVSRVSGSHDVAVVATGEHLCMTARGIRTPAAMTTSKMRGAFLDDASTRAEFLRLAGVP